MKKIYNQPNMKVADLDLQSIIALSNVDGDATVVSTEGINGTDDGDALSRDITNLWDKEW